MPGERVSEQPVGEQQLKTVPEMVVLRPQLSERVWGFEKLPEFLEQPQPGKPVGEAWLTAMECVDQETGLTLGALTRQWPTEFGAVDGSGFPLLMKWLFPREKLSVQVHPNDEQARTMGEPRGKTECWYVLSADPGATVAVGFEGEISAAEVERSIADGTLETKMRYLPVKSGDMVYLEAGTVHAMNPGVVVLETQQYSDTTYRLYDYGRPRELHLDRGLAVMNVECRSGLMAPEERDGFMRLASSPYFVVDRFKVPDGSARLGIPGKMQILVALQSGAAVRLASGAIRELPTGLGVILPASSTRGCTLEGAIGVEVIRVSVP